MVPWGSLALPNLVRLPTQGLITLGPVGPNPRCPPTWEGRSLLGGAGQTIPSSGSVARLTQLLVKTSYVITPRVRVMEAFQIAAAASPSENTRSFYQRNHENVQQCPQNRQNPETQRHPVGAYARAHKGIGDGHTSVPPPPRMNPPE